MVRVRRNAKRRRDESSPRVQNEGEMNPQKEETGGNAKRNERAPPTTKDETGGETSSQRGQNKGETNAPPPPQEETGGETSSQRGQNEGEMDPSSQEGTGGEDSSSTCSEDTTDNEITVTIDPDPLICPICFDPLRLPPIYQCVSGHVVCLSCWEKVHYICPTCNKPKGLRNIALEKMLEAIHLPCPNANYGCRMSVSFSQMEVHTETCEFGPSSGGFESSDSMAAATKGEEETTGKNELRFTIDYDSLECDICSDPLCPPLYQCINGHIACYSCYENVQNNCPTCDKSIGTRNIALEKMLESIHLPCPHANFGCHQSLSYSQMQVHTETCEFGPSLCPIPGCAHEAFSGEWQAHFIKDNLETDPPCCDGCSHCSYGASCTIILYNEDYYYTFLGPGKDVFLLVKESIPNVGNALSLYYIDLPGLGRNYFECELSMVGGPYYSSSLQSKSRVISIKEWKRGKVYGSSLLVPSRFLEYSHMKVTVLLNKKKW